MKTRRPLNLPKAIPPSSAEREYYRYLSKYVRTYMELMSSGLMAILPSLRRFASNEFPEGRQDSFNFIRMDENIEAKLARLFERIGQQLKDAFPDPSLRRWARAMTNSVNRNAKKNTVKVLTAVSKRKKPDEVPDFEPLMHDREISPYFENIVDENVGLIRSIPKSELETFKNQLVAMITQDQPQDQIRKAIQRNFNLSKGRAALIARDQVGKLNGALNKYRQQQLGGKRYVWRSSADSRERRDHRLLNNKIYFWSKPPIVNRASGRRGNPGDDFQCRCWAEMVVEDIFE